MAGSNDITIIIKDGIQSSIISSLQAISSQAKSAYSATQTLQSELNSLKVTSLNEIKKATDAASASFKNLGSSLSAYSVETLRAQTAQEKLSQAQAKTATAQAKSSADIAASQEASAAKIAAAQAQAQAKISAAAEKAKSDVTASQNAIAASSAKLAEVQQTSQAKASASIVESQNRQAASNAQAQAALAVAQNSTAASAAKLAQEQSRAAEAQSKAASAASKAVAALTGEELAQEKLQAALNRTEYELARSELMQLRLAQAQNKAAKSASGMGSGIGALYSKLILFTGGALAIGKLSESFVELSDKYQLMQNRLQNVATSQTQVNELMSRLTAVANTTRSPIDATVNSFQRFDRALREQGASQEESIRFTQTLNELLMMSGDTTQEATAATIQLSQAFNAGKLQGNDFHSVATELPAALDAIAKTMGVSVGQLKQLSTEGKITASVMRQAFASIATETDALAAKHLPTVEQSFVVLKNNVTSAVGEFNQAHHITATFSEDILYLANNLDLVSDAAKAVGISAAIFFSAAVLTNASANVAKLTTAVVALKDAEITLAAVRIATNPFAAITVGIGIAATALYSFRDHIKPIGDDLTTVADIGKVVFGDLGDFINRIWSDIESGFEKAAKFIERVENMLPDSLKTTLVSSNSTFDPSSINVPGSGGYIESVKIRAQMNAQNNQFWKDNSSALNSTTSPLRAEEPTEANNALGASSPSKSVKTIASINQQLDNEINRLTMLKDAREIQQKYDSIEQELAGKNISLTTEQSAAIRQKIATIQEGEQVQSKMDSAYEAATSPMRDYTTTTKALNILVKQGAISTSEYNRQLAVASENYKSSSDHLYSVNKDLDQQIELMKSVGDEQSVNQQLQQITNQLTSEYGDKAKDEAEKFRTKIELLQQASRYQSAYNSIYQDTIAMQKDGIAQIQAANDAQSKGIISPEVGNVQRIQGEGSISSGRINSGYYDASDIVKSTAAKATSDYTNLASGFTDSMGSFFTNFSNNFGDSVSKISSGSQTIKASLKSIASDGIGSLISSIAKLAAQYLIVQSITGISNLLGFSSSSSVFSSFSGPSDFSGPGTSIVGFSSGGYTGDGGRYEAAGIVHKGEYVVDAPTTARLGVSALDGLKNMSKSSRSSGNISQSNLTISLGGINVSNPNVTDGKLDDSTMKNMQTQIANMVQKQVQTIMTNQQRPGGLLYGKS